MDLPGMPFEVAMRASDKSLMRERFREKGLPSPRFVSLGAGVDSETATSGLSFPMVVKPVDSMGARGVRRIDTADQLQPAVFEAIRQSRSARAIVEEYIDGPEFSLDALVYRGEIHLCGIADRHIYFPPFFVEMGHTMPSAESRAAQEAVIDVFFRGIRGLGIDNGAAKGDIKFSSKGPVIGEIAARLSGGYMSGWTYPYSSAVQLTGAALNIAVGLPPGDLAPTRNWTSAERAFISIPGRVADIVGVDLARRTHGVQDLFMRAAEGDEVVFPTNNVQKCGNVISLAESRPRAVESAEIAIRKVLLRLEAGNPTTGEFLFGRRESWIPDAYSIEDPVALAALGSMPGYIGFADEPGSPARIEAVSMAVEPIAGIEENRARDWHGLGLGEGLARVRKETGCVFAGSRPDRLGYLFWMAFLRGGVQGAVWLIDTLSETLREGGPAKLKEAMDSWL